MSKKTLTIIISLVCTICSLFSIYEFFVQANYHITDESNLMEMYQMLALLIAGISFAIQAMKTSATHKILTIFLSLLSLIMMHREIETREFDLPNFVHLIFLAESRYLLIVPASILLFYLFYKIPYFWQNKQHIIFKPTTIMLFIGIVCYAILNEIFENGWIMGGLIDPFLEELVEMIGATLFLVASLFIVDDYRWMSQKKTVS